jgi:hypothetical protein
MLSTPSSPSGDSPNDDADLRLAGRVHAGSRAATADGMQYDGMRFRAECQLAGKLYGQRFGVDVAFGDPILGEPDVVTADDVLGFVSIEPPSLRLYPVETHIAEKLHGPSPRRHIHARMSRPRPRVALPGDAPDRAPLPSGSHARGRWLPGKGARRDLE